MARNPFSLYGREPHRRGVVLLAVALVAWGLGAQPVAADPAEPGSDVPDVTSTDSDVPDSEPHVQHALYTQEYGDIGCSVVEGFNDRCPVMFSPPHKSPAGQVLPSLIRTSPDGSLVFLLGRQQNVNQDGDAYKETVMAAYRTTPDDAATDGSLAWSRAFGEALPGKTTLPLGTAVSRDGRRLYVFGQVSGAGSATDGWVAAFDAATGELLRKRSMRELMPPMPEDPRTVAATGIAISPDDDQIVISAGASFPANEDGLNHEAWHLALDNNLEALVWTSRPAVPRPNWPGTYGDSIAFSPDGSRVFAQVNAQYPDRGNKGIVTVAYEAATGGVTWERMHTYPPEDGTQNPPGGLIVSPDGSRVVAAGTHYFYDPLVPEKTTGGFLLLAYDAADGASLWSAEYKATQDKCPLNRPYVLTPGRALAFSPSGDLLYLVGADGDNSGGCTQADVVRGPRVFAVQASTGEREWDRFFLDSAGRSCFALFPCDIAVAPGPWGGDEGSRVMVATFFQPHGGTGYYSLMQAIDGREGGLLWQGRYLDTYNDRNTSIQLYDAPAMSPDGSRVYSAVYEKSETRDWRPIMRVMGYDTRAVLPDLAPTSLEVSRDKRGATKLTATIVNSGLAGADGVEVRFLNGSTVLGHSVPVRVKVGESVTVSLVVGARDGRALRAIRAVVNPEEVIEESNYLNNVIRHESSR